MILDGQRHVVAEQFKGVKRVFLVQRIAFAPSEDNRSDELSPHFERANAFEEFGRDVAIRTEKNIVGGNY